MSFRRGRNYTLTETEWPKTIKMLGTSIFIFLGCLGCVEGIGNENSLAFNAISFGVAAFIGTQIFFRGSDGHLNPSVTIASLFFKKMKFFMLPIYCVAQCLGGLIGFGILKIVIPEKYFHVGSYEKYGLCTTVPKPQFPLFTHVAIEFFMTTFLIMVICSMWDIRNRKTDHANLKYALTMAFLTYAGGAFTGASMNPARSFAPAIWNNSWRLHWIYWVVPTFSGIFGGFTYTKFYGPDCCTRPATETPP